MDVTKSNFNQLLPEIKDAIDKSSFVAIDGEFTGLSNGPDVTVYDLPEEYYSKVRVGKMDYLLIQVGLCIFTYDESKKRLTHRAYNFYIFPHSSESRGPNNFLCEASALEFLTSNGFDFNKLFKEGITYLSYVEEQDMNEELENKYKKQVFDKIIVPDDQVDSIKQVCQRIGEYLNSDDTEELVLEESHNRFIRKLIYQTAYETFPDIMFSIETRVMGHRTVCMVIKKGKSKDDQKKEKYNKEREELAAFVGFSRVIRHLSESKKMIIGHNMLLDLCHFINRFYTPLPENYKEFKSLTNIIFPEIIDTKYMCNVAPFKDIIDVSVLNSVIERLRNAPFTLAQPEPDDEAYGYSLDCKKEHEAGYDAFITGCVFITLSKHLAAKNGVANIEAALPESHLLKPFKNKVHLMRVYDNAFINFSGRDVVPAKRDHVFYLKFPHVWVTTDITKLFEPYGQIYIKYCSSTSAWVTLFEQNKASQVMNDLVHCKGGVNCSPSLMAHQKQYTVMSWHQFQEKRHAEKKNSSTPRSVRCAELVRTLRFTNKRHKKISETNDLSAEVDSNDVDDNKYKDFKRKKNSGLQNAVSNGVVMMEVTKESTIRNEDTRLRPEAREFLLTDIVHDSELDDKSDAEEIDEISVAYDMDSIECLESLETVENNDDTDAKLFKEKEWED